MVSQDDQLQAQPTAHAVHTVKSPPGENVAMSHAAHVLPPNCAEQAVQAPVVALQDPVGARHWEGHATQALSVPPTAYESLAHTVHEAPP